MSDGTALLRQEERDAGWDVTEIIRWPQKLDGISFTVQFPRYFVLLKFPGHEAFYTKLGATFWTAVTRSTDTHE